MSEAQGGQVNATPDMHAARTDRVARIRSEIRSGIYDPFGVKLGIAADRLIDEEVYAVTRNQMPPLTKSQRKIVSAFLAEQRKRMTQEQWSESYQSWAHGGDDAWSRLLGLGGTDTQSALTWYQHFHRPGSREWRPSIIISALLAEACCGFCEGSGEVDSGGSDQSGRWLTEPCGYCDGTGMPTRRDDVFSADAEPTVSRPTLADEIAAGHEEMEEPERFDLCD